MDGLSHFDVFFPLCLGAVSSILQNGGNVNVRKLEDSVATLLLPPVVVVVEI